MRTRSWILIVLPGAAALLALWQFQQRATLNRLYVELQNRIQAASRNLASSESAVADWEQRIRALQQQRIQTNSSLAALVRQRAQFSSATSAARQAAQAERNRTFRKTLADTLDNPQQKEINRSLLENELRARFNAANGKLKLTADQIDQAIHLLVESELKKTDRLAALLRGEVPVADALQQRDAAFRELQAQLKSLLSDEAYTVYDEERQNAAKSQANRDTDLINKDLGAAAMNTTQTEQLHALIRGEVYNFIVDDTDTFRSPEDWEQNYNQAVEHIAHQAAAFLTPEQLKAFRNLAASDLAATQRTFAEKRKGYGL